MPDLQSGEKVRIANPALRSIGLQRFEQREQSEACFNYAELSNCCDNSAYPNFFIIPTFTVKHTF